MKFKRKMIKLFLENSTIKSNQDKEFVKKPKNDRRSQFVSSNIENTEQLKFIKETTRTLIQFSDTGLNILKIKIWLFSNESLAK